MLKASEEPNLSTTIKQISNIHIIWKKDIGYAIRDIERLEPTARNIEQNTIEMLASIMALKSLTWLQRIEVMSSGMA